MNRGKAVLGGAAALALLLLGGAAWLLSTGSAPSAGPGEAGTSSPAAGGPAAEGPGSAAPAAAAATAAPVPAGEVTVLGRLVRGGPPRPVAGEITISAPGLPPRTAAAAVDGRFEVTGLPHGATLALAATSPGLLPGKFHGIRTGTRRTVDLGDLLLGVGVRLEVRVRDLSDRPVPGATVSLLRENSDEGWGDWIGMVLAPSARPSAEAAKASGPDGIVVFEAAPPGTWVVLAEAKGHASGTARAVVREGLRSEPVRVLLLPTWTLRGTVFGPEGKPLPGAVVTGAPPWGTEGIQFLRADATADVAGKYVLDGLRDGPVSLGVRFGPGLIVSVGAVEVPAVREFDIHLGPGATVRGRVLDDASGAPVEGAEVSFQVWDEHGGERGGFARTLSGPDGAFSAEHLPPGMFGAPSIRKAGYLPWPDARVANPSSQARLEDGQVLEREARLRRGAVVAGRVGDGTGKPVAGARVKVQQFDPNVGLRESETAISAADGAYRIDGVDVGEGLLAVVAQGFHQAGFPTEVWSAFQGGGLPPEWTVTVPASGEAKKDLVLARGGTVAGTVVDPEGRPAAGISVSVSAQEGTGGGGESGPTDAEGRFRVEGVVPGEKLAVSGSGPAGLHGGSDPFALAEGGTAEGVRVALKAGSCISGRLRRADAGGIEGALLRIAEGAYDPKQPWDWIWRKSSARVQPVGADGAFRIEGLAAGTWTLLASAEGAGSVTAPSVEVGEGETRENVDVVLPAERALSGKVLTEKDEPVAGARISVRETTGQGQDQFMGWMSEAAVVAVSPADGDFVVRGLAEGSYEITALAEGFVAGTEKAEAGASGVVVRMRRGDGIAGVVVEASTGAPLADIPVQAQPTVFKGGIWMDHRATTGKDGSFAIGGLDPGDYQVTAAAQDWNAAAIDWAPETQGPVKAGTRDLRFALDHGLAIAGRIQDAEGKAITARFVIQVTGRNDKGDLDGSRQRWMQSQADGTFRAGGLTAGSYDLTVQPMYGMGAAAGWASTTASGVAAGSEDIVLTLRKGLTISGRVLDEHGSPWTKGGWLQARVAGSREADASVVMTGFCNLNDDGTFETNALEPGRTYDLLLQNPPGGLAAPVKGVAAGARDVVIRVTKGGSISGKVLDESGAPVGPGVPVSAEAQGVGGGEPGAQSDAVTAEDGSFTIDGLGDFKFKVTAGGGNSDWFQATSDAVGIGTTGVQIKVKRGSTLSGRLVDSSGNPVKVQAVMAHNPADEDGGFSVTTEPAEDGSFVLKGLPAGKVAVAVLIGDGPPKECGTFDVPGSGVAVTVPK